MKIIVIDGQGGKMGAALTKQLIESFPDRNIISRLVLTAWRRRLCLKQVQKWPPQAKTLWLCAHRTPTSRPMEIFTANSLLGEITPKMAMAVSESPQKRC